MIYMAQIGRKTTYTPEEEKIGGFGVYRDDRGRPVYWNRFNKTAYLLTGKTKPFRTYSSRFYIGFIAGALTYVFNMPLIACIAIGLLVYAVMEYKFRSFLKTLPEIKYFDPRNHVNKIEAEAKMDTYKIVLKIVLAALMVVLLYVNAMQHGYTGFFLYMNYGLCIIAAILCIVEIRVLFLNLKNKKG